MILRALQIGLTLDDLESVTIGDLYDILTESSNDDYDYPIKATKSDFERF